MARRFSLFQNMCAVMASLKSKVQDVERSTSNMKGIAFILEKYPGTILRLKSSIETFVARQGKVALELDM